MNQEKVLVDTDIFVDHLRGYGPAKMFIDRIERGEIAGCVSAVSIVELYAGSGSANKLAVIV